MLPYKRVENSLMNEFISLNEGTFDFQAAYRLIGEMARTVDLPDRPKRQAKVPDDSRR